MSKIIFQQRLWRQIPKHLQLETSTLEGEKWRFLQIWTEETSTKGRLESLRKDLSEEVYSLSVRLLSVQVYFRYLMSFVSMDGYLVLCLFLLELSVRVLYVQYFIAASWSLFMIAESAIKVKVKNFSKLSNYVGGKALELFLQINILIYMWGSCISYQIISKYYYIKLFSIYSCR